jgi:hypothetical protein
LFAVRTPTAVVTDLGTEFGVEVSDTGETQSHVFLGSVQLQQTGIVEGQESPSNTIILHANEAASVTIQHGVKEKSAKENQLVLSRSKWNATEFVLPNQMRQYAEEQRLKPLRRWQAYSRELRKDPALVAYYDFQMKDDNCAALPNLSAAGRALDGRVMGGDWIDGRLPDKLALKFNGRNDGVKIRIPQVMDDLTLAVWVYIDFFESEAGGILMSDGYGPQGRVHWQLLKEGRFCFDTFGSEPKVSGKSSVCLTHDQYHRWIHLAVVYDHIAAKLRFYLNGSFVSEVSVGRHIPIQIGSARIGTWNGDDTRNFHGQIDEVAILNRAFSAGEVHRMFEAGNPDAMSEKTEERKQ